MFEQKLMEMFMQNHASLHPVWYIIIDNDEFYLLGYNAM
jgi:hypothetical protein